MNKKTRELVLIKSGEYMLDMSKLVFGGIVLVVIMQIENMSNQILVLRCPACTRPILSGLILSFSCSYKINLKMGLNLFCKSMVYQVLMQTFNGFYECKKQPTDLRAGWCEDNYIIL